jgi:hypothetical protein
MDRVISGACDSIHVWIGVVENGLGKKRTSTEKEGGGRGRARPRCERATRPQLRRRSNVHYNFLLFIRNSKEDGLCD